jgi:hypothetical protein
MYSTTIRQLFTLSLILILFSLLIPGCTPPAMDIKVDLTFSEPPVLNKPVKITETITLRKDFPSSESQNISSHIKLPDGFEKVDGNLTWNSTVVRGEPKTLSVVVKSTRFGSFQIVANAGWPTVNPPGSGGIKELYITVSEKGATIDDSVPQSNGFAWAIADPNNLKTDAYLHHSRPNHTIPPLNTIDSSQLSYPPITSNMSSKSGSLQTMTLTNSLTITGTWYVYVSANVSPDQPGDADVVAPMVWGTIHIKNARTNVELNSGYTDLGSTAGHFSITVENPLNDGF